jgi:hypothetical protein
VGIAMLVMPWLLIRTEDRAPGASASGMEGADDLAALPDALRIVAVPRLRYAVKLESGVVVDEKTWSETRVDVSTSGGQVHAQSGTAYSAPSIQVTPVEVHARSTVTQKDRIWMRTADGRELAWTFSGDHLLTRRSQVISILTLSGHHDQPPALLAYNHTTQKLTTLGRRALNELHALPAARLWLATTVVGIIGSCLVMYLAGKRSLSPAGVLLPAVVIAVLVGLYVGIIKLIYAARRDRQFNQKYLPAYRRFLEQITPELLKRFAGAS